MERLNVLLITADDMHGRSPSCMGGYGGVTPHIDALAGSGMLFRRAHVPIAVCQPSRSAMLTGLWPHRNGAEGFEPIDPGIPVLNDVLRPAGYLCGILGKVMHLTPVERFGWDHRVDRPQLGSGRDPRRYRAEAERFIARAQREGRPWFLMANAHDPHRPFHGAPDEEEMIGAEALRGVAAPSHVYAPEEITVPGFLPDLPDVRAELAQYCSSARRCDDVVGGLLALLEETGESGRTLVIFLSDNGMAFPFAKANCYLQSTLTPLIVRWPGLSRPGSSDGAHFVSGLDLLPTICDATGVAPPPSLDGRSLAPLLRAERESGRDFVVTCFHETSAKQRFEMRAIQTAEWGYIWNRWSDGTRHYKAENMAGLSWRAMCSAAGANAALGARAAFYLTRAPDELYALGEDPDALVNLAGRPEHVDALARSQDRLAEELTRIADPLAPLFAQHLAANRAIPQATTAASAPKAIG